MKAISDTKMAGIIKRLRSGVAYATYTIEGKEAFHEALIEQASLMAPGSERLVYFQDEGPSFSRNGYCIAKMYYHESYEQGGSAFVAVDLFDGEDRYHLTVIKSDIDGTWRCTEKVRLRTSADIDERGMVLEYDTGPANVQTYIAFPAAKIILVTVLSGARIHTVTLDWRALGNEKDAAGATFTDQIYLPFEGVRLTVTKGDGEATFAIDDLDGGSASICRICGYN